MNYKEIIKKLPYKEPFLFVDELTHIDENGAEGSYKFVADSHFFEGHFIDNPVTPGVILTECCAQIGLVAFGIFLMQKEKKVVEDQWHIGLSSSAMDFYLPVYPNETVRVVSNKMYYRFHKLKCEVRMYNSENKLVCKGTISGMLKT